MLGWDSATYRNVVEQLEERRLLKAVAVLKGKGRPVVLYEILEDGKKVPSIKHRFYVHYISKQLSKRGIECFAYVKQGPDIVIPSLKAAINVELGGSDIMGNIHESLQEYHFVAVCSDDGRVLERIKSQIQEKEGKRAFVLFVWDVPDLIEAKKN